MPKVEWASADVTDDDLAPHFDGADAVVSLSWLIQPSKDLTKLWMVNVEGNSRIMRAVEDAGVPALLYASSVGVYSPGPKDRYVDESWPRNGVPTSYYARHKAEVERRLDRFEAQNPEKRVVRIRPALVFKKEAAQGIRRLFAGPFLPTTLARPGLINLIPEVEGLRGQVVHSYDVGEAFRLAIVGEAHGAFNVAAEPVIDAAGDRAHPRRPDAAVLRARPAGGGGPLVAARAAAGLARLARHGAPDPAHGHDPGARDVLGWTPQHTADEALLDLLEGLRTGAGLDTPPLSPRTSGPFRVREVLTGVGRSEP